MDVADVRNLDAILSPDTVAVIGVSRNPDSIGRQIFKNLLHGEFQGAAYPVNPNAGSICGVRAYPDVGSIPETVDLAVVVVPAPYVLDIVEACGQEGVQGLVIISAGFREIGEEGAQREARLMDLLNRYGMRAVGPNCMGVLNNHPTVRMNATFSPQHTNHGGLAFVSQSGALGMAILDLAEELGLGLSSFVSLGNRMDVSSNDLLARWRDQEDVEAVLLYLEHFGNPRNFIDVAREITKEKPVVAVKSGRSKAGARAAQSHTGALAEADALTDALFEQCGVIRADTIDEVFAIGRVLARAPEPKGNRVAVLTNSGGPGIMVVDALEQHGLALAELRPETKDRLAEVTPGEASLANPVDLTAGGGPEAYRVGVEAIAKDEGVDALMVIYTPPTFMRDEDVVDAILSPATGDIPVVACVMGRGRGDTAFQALSEAGLPTFTFPESAVASLGTYQAWAERKRRPQGKLRAFHDTEPARVAGLLEGAAEEGREWLRQEEAFEVLEAYGIPSPPHRVVDSPSGAEKALEDLSAPCVVKAQAAGLVHKTDVGGLIMNIETPEGAKKAFGDLEANLREGGFKLEAALVQEQRPKGREVIMGISSDPAFGPTVLFGMGGVHAEVLRDVVVRLAPLTDEEASRMVRGVRGWPLLEGVRGEARADVDALEALLLRLSWLASEQEAIRELDVNPVIVYADGEGGLAVDARVRVWPEGKPPRAPGVLSEMADAR